MAEKYEQHRQPSKTTLRKEEKQPAAKAGRYAHYRRPLHSLSQEDRNKAAVALWEYENMGGIKENNNRLPLPVVYLLVLTIISAFMLSFPLWGQRPTAAVYEEYVALMDTPEVQALPNDAARMQYIVETAEANGSDEQLDMQQRHPVSMDDLRIMKPLIEELKAEGEVNRLDEYTFIGDAVVLANFEGNIREDGTVVRKQPWWDIGYLINIFYVAYFCLAVFITIKRLPSYTIQPSHAGHDHPQQGHADDDEADLATDQSGQHATSRPHVASFDNKGRA